MLAGTVMLGDLSDFIAPSQNCVNPLFSSTSGTAPAQHADARGVAKISLESDFATPMRDEPVKPNLIKTGAGNVAKVSLNDCLACSGCVTSAEAVLVTQQSIAEVMRALKDTESYKIYVISLSPQSLAAIAVHFGLETPMCAYTKLTTFFKSIGFNIVIDTVMGADIALLEARDEFLECYKSAAGRMCDKAAFVAPPPSVAVSATHVQHQSTGEITLSERVAHQAFPILSSACPGWVCYAEKTVPESLGFISDVKSPQQITGACVKTLLSRLHDATVPSSVSAKEVFHVTVMPCYDKKLEASRKDFHWSLVDAQEVDCVITTGEVLELLAEFGVHNLSDIAETPRFGCVGMEGPELPADIERLLCGATHDGARLCKAIVEQDNSDGFMEYVLASTARILAAPACDEVRTVWQTGRNLDFKECVVFCGPVELRGALAYGFRNIQGIIRKMKTNKIPYHYVEVMACPSGCVNGGGQLRSTDPAVNPLEIVGAVATNMRKRTLHEPGTTAVADHLRTLLRTSHDALLRTQYHHVPKLEAAAIKW